MLLKSFTAIFLVFCYFLHSAPDFQYDRVTILNTETHLISSGNWALVTRKLEMWHWWRRRRKALISGYMMGSPTRDRAQCFTAKPSSKRSGRTPGTPDGDKRTAYQHWSTRRNKSGVRRGNSARKTEGKIWQKEERWTAELMPGSTIIQKQHRTLREASGEEQPLTSLLHI